MRKILIVLVLALLCSCAVKENMEDGYQPGDVSDGLIEDKGFYCSPPYRGIRAVGRFVITMLGGVTVPDICAVIDGVAGQPAPTTSE